MRLPNCLNLFTPRLRWPWPRQPHGLARWKGASAPALALHCALWATLTTATAAHAQAGAACNAQGLPSERNACTVQAYQEADTAQTILYGDVMRALSAHERPLLRTDQNQWNRQRVTQCKQAHRADEARPDWNARYHQCLIAQIAQRRTALMHWLHHGEAPSARAP